MNQIEKRAMLDGLREWVEVRDAARTKALVGVITDVLKKQFDVRLAQLAEDIANRPINVYPQLEVKPDMMPAVNVSNDYEPVSKAVKAFQESVGAAIAQMSKGFSAAVSKEILAPSVVVEPAQNFVQVDLNLEPLVNVMEKFVKVVVQMQKSQLELLTEMRTASPSPSYTVRHSDGSESVIQRT